MKQPLGIPTGSVRAAIVLSLIVIVGVSIFVEPVKGASGTLTGLVGLLGFAIRDYFEGRKADDAVDPGQPAVG